MTRHQQEAQETMKKSEGSSNTEQHHKEGHKVLSTPVMAAIIGAVGVVAAIIIGAIIHNTAPVILFEETFDYPKGTWIGDQGEWTAFHMADSTSGRDEWIVTSKLHGLDGNLLQVYGKGNYAGEAILAFEVSEQATSVSVSAYIRGDGQAGTGHGSDVFLRLFSKPATLILSSDTDPIGTSVLGNIEVRLGKETKYFREGLNVFQYRYDAGPILNPKVLVASYEEAINKWYKIDIQIDLVKQQYNVACASDDGIVNAGPISILTRTDRYWRSGEWTFVIGSGDGRGLVDSIVVREKRMPAGWYYGFCLALLAVAGCGILLLRWQHIQKTHTYKLEKEPSADEDKIPPFRDDRPLQSAYDDRLGFTPFAEGLSKFLRNRDNQSRLTLAITGQWGSGKSSLMRLLKNDLDENGWTTVWYNAWHNEEEAPVFPSILDTIRLKAIPNCWTIEGVASRIKLVWYHFLNSRSGKLIILPAAVFMALLVYFFISSSHMTHLRGVLWKAVDTINAPDIGIQFLSKDWYDVLVTGLFLRVPGESSGVAVLLLIVSGFLVLCPLIQWASIYRINPLYLLVTVISRRFRVHDLKMRSGFRQQFCKTMEEFVDAIKPRQLAIFIDDLDRCKPECVMETLEATNYLIDACDCYVIIGIDWHRVRECVARALYLNNNEANGRETDEGAPEQTASVADDTSPVGMDRGNGNEGLLENGYSPERYMRKIINVGTRVPKRDVEKLRKMLESNAVASAETTQQKKQEKAREKRIYRAVDQFFIPSAVCIILLIVGILGWGVNLQKPYFGSARWKSAAEHHRKIIPKPNEGGPKNPTETSPNGDLEPLQPGLPDPPMPSDDVKHTFLLVKIVGVLIGIVFVIYVCLVLILFIKHYNAALLLKVKSEQDQLPFTEALVDWYPLVHEYDSTPRWNKRFQNYARLYAMISEEYVDELDPRTIVALTALQFSYPKLWTRFCQSDTLNFRDFLKEVHKDESRPSLSDLQKKLLSEDKEGFIEAGLEFVKLASELF